MVNINIKRTLSLLVIGIISTIGLTGCFKGEISIDVKPNGSGIISVALGMTQQAKAFASSGGNNITQDIQKSLAEADSSAKDVSVTSWMDGEYEWVKAQRAVPDLQEINNILNSNELFNHFALTRNRGLLQDKYILEAELAPLDNQGTGSSIIDPSALIQMSFSARLPGEVIETNGLRDINDPNLMVWNVASTQPISIKATSITWNWVNIIAISGLCVVFGAAVVGTAGFIIYRSSRKSKKPNTSQPAIVLPNPTVDFADLGIERLLSEINEKVLNSAGQIRTRQGEIALIWKDQLNRDRLIDVKTVDDNRISVNNQVIQATKEDAKATIIDALRKQVRK